MSYRVVNLTTGKTVHQDHTYAGCERWISKQAHPGLYEIEEND
jgi:hypothetical protein